MPAQGPAHGPGLFAMKDALYGCYLRVGDPGVQRDARVRAKRR